jgi:hypothetical protein
MTKRALLLAALPVLLSCDPGLGPREEPMTTGRIMPLAVGNYWRYKEVHASGSVDTVTVIVDTVLVLSINRKSTTVYALRWGGFADYWLSSEQPDGLHDNGALSAYDSLLQDYVRRAIPVRAGQMWTLPQVVVSYPSEQFSVSGTVAVKCVSISASFDTDIGRFDCILYREYRDTDTTSTTYVDTYYARDIGCVGYEFCYNTVVGERRLLIAYKVQ